MWDRYVWLAAKPECPVGMYCGALVDTGYVYFPDDPLPTWGDSFDVWGIAAVERRHPDRWRWPASRRLDQDRVSAASGQTDEHPRLARFGQLEGTQ